VSATIEPPKSAARFHLRTLGTLALTNAAGTIVLGAHGHQRRRLALLSVLSVAGDRGLSRDRLLLLFWPEKTQARARHSLDQLLYALRNTVSEQVFAGVNPVRLNSEVLRSDVGEFLAAVERNDPAAAVEAYGGRFLDGFYLGDSPEFEQWVDAERARLAARYTEALGQLARSADAAGDREASVRWWRALAESEPENSNNDAAYRRALASVADDTARLPEERRIAPLPPRKRRARWPLYIAGALIAALSLAAAQWARSLGTRPVAERSIVVLPFVNVGGDPRDAAIVDGLTEELIAVLEKLGELKVIGRTSAFAFKNSNLDVRRIADSLRVAYALAGSVQKDSAHLRVRVELVDARDGSTRWAESYDGDLRDVFRMQSDVAGAVARELDVRLGVGQLARIKRGSTASPVAHELYLKATDATMMRSDSGVRTALGYVEEAIRLDPNFAAAYSARARLLDRSIVGNEASARERHALAEQSVLRALALDDSLADAHAVFGTIREDRFDFATAEAELKRAVALEPTTAGFHEGLAGLYILSNRPVEALAEARRAVELDPLSPSATADLAHALVSVNRPDEALALLAPLNALPVPLLRARRIAAQAYALKHMWPEAITELSRNAPNAGANGRAFLGYLLARAGRTAEAKAILASLLERERSSSEYAAEIATVYTGLGDKDHAFAWLDRISDDRATGARSAVEIVRTDLAPDPRFEAVARRLGIRTDSQGGVRPQ
jgi:serine/threonine-protein kinase